jgi:ParB family chromosome partitioning protein
VAVNADRHLGGMATEEFLSCLSKAEIEAVASAHGILPKPTGKLTRAAVIAHFKDGDYVYPGAKFGLTADQIAGHAESSNPRPYAFGDDMPEDGEQPDIADASGLKDAA